jgi:hypothetical protein
MKYSIVILLIAFFALSCSGEKAEAPKGEIETPQAKTTADSDTSMRNPNFDYDRYKPITMKALMDTLAVILQAESTGIYIPGVDFSVKVDMVFGGMQRDMDPGKLTALNFAFKSVSFQRAVNLYQHEVLFKDGSDEYWIPVQENILPVMGKELVKGDKVSLYIVWFGAVYDDAGNPEPFLLTNEYWKGPQGKKK